MTKTLAPMPSTETAAWAQISSGRYMGEQDGPPMRILVVDRDCATRDMVVSYLEEHNMRAIPVSGREDMGSQFSIIEPNLVILELHLGSDNGLDLLREIRLR